MPLVTAAVLLVSISQAQPNPDLLTQSWNGRWIVAAGTDPFGYGVYHFRRTIELAARPESFSINVTADNRYQLFVNGERVAWGPARGDLSHWRYETLDIAKYLKPGKNVFAAVVWNFGQYAPEAQTTWRTGFLVQGQTRASEIVNTDGRWKAIRNESYEPLYFTHSQMGGYFVAGPGDRVDGRKYPWAWETVDFDDSGWPAAQNATRDGRDRGNPRDSRDGPNMWFLVPRNIPLMENTPERIQRTRQVTGITVPAGFPASAASFNVPANSSIRILLDQTHLTTAYPELVVSKGRGSTIEMGYAESLFQSQKDGRRQGNDKGNRNDVEGKFFRGYSDIFIPDGGDDRLFRPLWWRTYRYIELKIETKEEPLTIVDLRGIYTGYPFERKATFDAGSELLTRILDVGWRTARLDAHETFMDCPYYEQLQYVGDTRIQALISLYNSGDPRLVRNAISLINDSRTAEGATMSRAPTRQQQYIPPFSLWWIGMVHDYFRYQDDPEFVRQMLPGVHAVLAFFTAKQQQNGSLGPVPWWNYVDWTPQWASGVPPRGPNGSSAPQDLQLLLAFDWAADLESAHGSALLAGEYRRRAVQLRETIRRMYWDMERRAFADTPDHRNYSQHTNVLAVLAEVITGAEARTLVTRVTADSSMVQCSYYFKHYLHSAVHKVGEGDRYIDLLGDWKDMLDRGLTTFAEKPDPTRSDCHAWSASPNFELFRTVLGIDSAAPGFKKVLIQPFPGKLTRLSGTIPHPQGSISVAIEVSGNRLRAEVVLPAGVTGEFVWKGRRLALAGGRNRVSL